MQIVGHGIDLVETQRIEQLVDAHGERFLDRCFTVGERSYAGNKRRRIEHLAGRFAAKEAALKALGTGWAGGIAWTEVEVIRQDSGQPTLVLHGLAAERARERGVRRWHISITHTDGYAMSSVIAEGK